MIFDHSNSSGKDAIASTRSAVSRFDQSLCMARGSFAGMDGERETSRRSCQ
jgi:hypothetical protein